MRTTSSGQSVLLLLDVVEVLERRKIFYVVVGAVAAGVHGVNRSSEDADAVIVAPSSTLADLQEEFQKEGLRADLSRGAPDDPITAVLMLRDKFGNKVDLLMGVHGMEVGVRDRCFTTSFLGSEVRIIGMEDFIAMKMGAGGHKDLDDVRGVLDVSGDKLNVPLLKKLTRRFGLDEARRLASLLKEKHLLP